MQETYFMPVRVYSGENCLLQHPEVFAAAGKKALIVCGRNSAKRCGVLADIEKILNETGRDFAVFDRVEPNPSIETIYEGAAFARSEGADFIVAAGGGSPMDAAKAIAVLACESIPRDGLFQGNYGKALPMIHIPTTAGTGSELTPYAILTDDRIETKMTMSGAVMFPKAAFLDGKYMAQLPYRTTVHTAVDALSHAAEGMLSNRSSRFSDALAKQSLQMIAAQFPALEAGRFDPAARQSLLEASALAGMVISQTGTTVVHTMGYSFTYFLGTDHGRANGLTLGQFLALGEAQCPARIREILSCLGMTQAAELTAFLRKLLQPDERLSEAQVRKFTEITMKRGAKKLSDCMVRVSETDILNLYAGYRQEGVK